MIMMQSLLDYVSLFIYNKEHNIRKLTYEILITKSALSSFP